LLTLTQIVDTPYGRCAIVEVAEADLAEALAALPASERIHALQFSGFRRREFVAGRTAIHQLIAGDVAVLSDDRGAPLVPSGLTGSISHKGSRALAIVAPVEHGHVGVDLERAVAPRGDIGSRILSPREPVVTGKSLTRVFAIKEAIYKAVDPIVRRYVGFHEVEIIDAGARVVDPRTLPVRLEFWCIEHEGYWVAAARANPLDLCA